MIKFKRDCQKLEGWEIININLQIYNNKSDYLIFINDLKRFIYFFKMGFFEKFHDF
jgi:hypothetical protein